MTHPDSPKVSTSREQVIQWAIESAAKAMGVSVADAKQEMPELTDMEFNTLSHFAALAYTKGAESMREAAIEKLDNQTLWDMDDPGTTAMEAVRAIVLEGATP